MFLHTNNLKSLSQSWWFYENIIHSSNWNQIFCQFETCLNLLKWRMYTKTLDKTCNNLKISVTCNKDKHFTLLLTNYFPLKDKSIIENYKFMFQQNEMILLALFWFNCSWKIYHSQYLEERTSCERIQLFSFALLWSK